MTDFPEVREARELIDTDDPGIDADLGTQKWMHTDIRGLLRRLVERVEELSTDYKIRLRADHRLLEERRARIADLEALVSIWKRRCENLRPIVSKVADLARLEYIPTDPTPDEIDAEKRRLAEEKKR